MSIRYLLITLLIASLPLLANATEPNAELIYTDSIHDVSTTMDRLETLVKGKGLGVIARLDHQAAAGKAKLQMNAAQVLIFGNPKLGTPLMQENPASALDLPLRVAVYSDQQGKTKMVYHNPLSLAGQYQITHAAILKKMAGALKALTSKAGN